MSWRDRAACRDMPLTMFVGGTAKNGSSRRLALEVCAECPVRVECLEDCLAFRCDLPGVYGGTTEEDRDDPTKARRIAAWGRPPPAYDAPLPLPRPRSGPAPQHGGRAAYRTHGCRCEPCVTNEQRRTRAARVRRQARRAEGEAA